MAGNNLPPPQSPFVDVLLNLSYDGYQYLLSLLNIATTQLPTSTVSTGLKSTGATQATSLPLSNQWNLFSTVPLLSGALLQSLQPGQSQSVFNNGANSLNVYPPPGFSINGLTANAPYVLGTGFMQVFNFYSGSSILTAKLQIP